MPERLLLVAGDTAPALELTVRRRGRPVPIPNGAVVTARIKRPGLPTLVRGCAITDAAGGKVLLDWEPGDLALPDDARSATYRIATIVTNGADVETAPVELEALVRAP